MGGCGHHAVVTFLEGQNSIHAVDTLFRHLVEVLHRIPFCASFGVSCAGHFHEVDSIDKNHPDCFYPEPWGHLNISVIPPAPHIQELLGLLQTTIGRHSDISFKKIKHAFGPPQGSELEIWEMRIGDNKVFEPYGEKYCGGYLEKKKYEQIYIASKARYAEIVAFWADIEATVTGFCAAHGFIESNIPKRIRELEGRWYIIKTRGELGICSINDPCLTK